MIAFGPFRLLPQQRRLERDGEPLRVGGRALDILIALAMRAGDVVSNRELLDAVWRDIHVDEGSLRFHIKNLRRALGDDEARPAFVANVPGRGYCFVAPVSRLRIRDQPHAGEARAGPKALPLRAASMVGRSATLAALRRELQTGRLVTVAGPGGMGKTTLAIAAAAEFGAACDNAIAFADLSAVEDGDLVPGSVAAALGAPPDRDGPARAILKLLGKASTLLVLDNCEQVVGAVASLAETILAGAAEARLLVTSREPLRVAGERVYRVAPLDAPPASATLSAHQALTDPAVELFVGRANAQVGGFQLDDSSAPAVGAVCRRLDGIPLAIELAAASVESLGVPGLCEGLENMFALLTRGRRSALPRHQTLRATLDWSYNLLSPTEQAVLRRFSLFRSAFDLQSALALTDDLPLERAIDAIANLVAKSLVNSTSSGASEYRLLETTKAYAREKLGDRGEALAAARRHAEHHLRRLRDADHVWEEREHAARFAGAVVDDVRAALDWAFSPAGDTGVGVDLLCASGRLWFELSLSSEFQGRIRAALARLGAASELDPAREARLQISLGQALWYAGSYGDATQQAFARGLDLAQHAEVSADLQLQALWGRWAGERARGRYAAALPIAERYVTLAGESAGLAYRLLGYRILGLTHHFLGEQGDALNHFVRVRAEALRARNPPNTEFQIGPELASQTMIARILWLRGFPDQAMATLQTAVEAAQALGHWHSYYYVISVAGFALALWTGDQATVDAFEAVTAERGAQDRWMRCWLRLSRLRAEPTPGPLVASYFEPRLDIHTFHRISEQLESATMAPPPPDEDVGDGRWCLPEVMRVNAELRLWRAGPGAAAAAEAALNRSLELARSQGTLSWELRAATSLAQLWRGAGRAPEARDLLARTCDRFTEGFGTRDLVHARTLLETWAA